MPLIANFVIFQIGWFSSVLGAAYQLPLLGPLVVLVAIVLHLRFAQRPLPELALIAACGVIGAFFDSSLVVFGWVAYPSGMFHQSLAPYWIIGMWMLFATTLNVSLGWLRGRAWLAAILGLIAGPMSYVGGQKLGGITFVDQTAALLTLGIGWAIMLPALSLLAEVLDGTRSSPAAVVVGERI